MKSLVKYRGGKTRELPYLTKHVPKFSGKYVEPFFGGGAMYFHLEPKMAIINDINAKLMGFYHAVKNDFDQLRRELDEVSSIYSRNRADFEKNKTKNPEARVEDKNESFYYSLRDMFNATDLSKYSEALLYFFINKTSYSGMIRYNSKGEFNVPYGRYANLNTNLVTKKHHELLAGAEIHNTDYKDVFDLVGVDDFVFLDPPYDCIFSDYGNDEHRDGFGIDNHVELSIQFRKLCCPAIMVIGRTDLTEKLYGDLIIDEYAKNYSVNIRNRFKSVASHIVISNRR